MKENNKESNPMDEYWSSVNDTESLTLEDIKSLGFVEMEKNHYRSNYNNEIFDLVQVYENGKWHSHLSILDDKLSLKSGMSGVITSKQELSHLMDNLEKMTLWLTENSSITKDGDIIIVNNNQK